MKKKLILFVSTILFLFPFAWIAACHWDDFSTAMIEAWPAWVCIISIATAIILPCVFCEEEFSVGDVVWFKKQNLSPKGSVWESIMLNVGFDKLERENRFGIVIRTDGQLFDLYVPSVSIEVKGLFLNELTKDKQ